MTKKTNKYYFTQDVDDAIVTYNDPSLSYSVRNTLYSNVIYPALDKLAENLINTYKVPYVDLEFTDLKHDLVAFITERLSKFSPNSGKAFSYFTKVGINYLIGLNTKAYEKTKEQVDLMIVDEERDIVREVYRSEFTETLDCFINEWVDKVDRNLKNYFTSKVDRSIADSILELFRQRKVFDNYNKKVLYLLIRERSDVPTHKVTKVVNFLRENFKTEFTKYQKTFKYE